MFREVQNPSPKALLFVIALIGLSFWVAYLGAPEDMPAHMGLIMVGVFLFTLFLMGLLRMVTQVGGGQITIRSAYVFRKSYSLNDIEAAEAITYRPLRDFGGWGIRFGKGGIMYSARGNQAVKMVHKTGKTVYIGTQDSAGLMDAIKSGARG